MKPTMWKPHVKASYFPQIIWSIIFAEDKAYYMLKFQVNMMQPCKTLFINAP